MNRKYYTAIYSHLIMYSIPTIFNSPTGAETELGATWIWGYGKDETLNNLTKGLKMFLQDVTNERDWNQNTGVEYTPSQVANAIMEVVQVWTIISPFVYLICLGTSLYCDICHSIMSLIHMVSRQIEYIRLLLVPLYLTSCCTHFSVFLCTPK